MAATVLQTLAPKLNLAALNFMFAEETVVNGAPCLVTRCGYTGEDGFEIAVPASAATALCQRLLADQRVLMAGLGARDSLRLEAGLCLYGHDLNDTITPVEAGLLWTITKRRREAGGFPGFSVFQQQIKSGVARKRVGLTTAAPAREHTKLVDASGKEVGTLHHKGNRICLCIYFSFFSLPQLS
jgi:aminomethyltransferase